MVSPCPIQGALSISPSQHDACLQQMNIWSWWNVFSCLVPEYQPLSLLCLLRFIRRGRIPFFHHCQCPLALPLPGPQDSTPSSLGLSVSPQSFFGPHSTAWAESPQGLFLFYVGMDTRGIKNLESWASELGFVFWFCGAKWTWISSYFPPFLLCLSCVTCKMGMIMIVSLPYMVVVRYK